MLKNILKTCPASSIFLLLIALLHSDFSPESAEANLRSQNSHWHADVSLKDALISQTFRG